MSKSETLIDLAGACEFFGGEKSPIDRSTFYRGIRAGRFPKPIKIGKHLSRWRLADCEAALQKMIDASSSPQAA